MTLLQTSEETIKRALVLLQQSQPPEKVLSLLSSLSPGQPFYAQAQHLRAVCVFRMGDAVRAKALLIDAFKRGDRSPSALFNLASATEATGMPDDAMVVLLDALSSTPARKFPPLLQQILQALGFFSSGKTLGKDAVFEKLLLPLLKAVLERFEMNIALHLEAVIYENYVKATETEEHFGSCMGRMAPLFTAAGHHWRRVLPPLPQPEVAAPYHIGFFIHSASMLAHIEVLLQSLKGYRMLDDQPFIPTVYCYQGSHPAMERALAELGVRLVKLPEVFPEAAHSGWDRLLRFRELLSQEKVHELVWVSLVNMMPLCFGMRIAPVQTWFAMKYRCFSHEDIDGYVSGSALTRFGTLAGRRWRMAMLGVDDWYDASVEAEAAKIRAALPAKTVIMTLARTEKMRDPVYLQTMAGIIKARPEVMFLWAGREETPEIVQVFREAGVLDRTRFIGWVHTRLYAQVADIFLDTFPFPCGFTLFQAMAAAKPVVIFDSPEAAQTGMWNFIKPLIDDGEGTPEERAELRSFIGDDTAPLISIARSPEHYITLAKRLIDDSAARAAAGAASKRMMDRYFSDPRVMGSSLARHFIELIEERRGTPPVQE
ncbi:MAG: hypothetical protein K0S16_26 [Moraxellaceae bacterium]|jgi:hypothetical protein|nr:hypothetical protein [Moraxellaceae bacterium]